MSKILETVRALREFVWLSKQIMVTQGVTGYRSGMEGSIIDKRHMVYRELLDQLLAEYPEVKELTQRLNFAEYGNYQKTCPESGDADVVVELRKRLKQKIGAITHCDIARGKRIGYEDVIKILDELEGKS